MPKYFQPRLPITLPLEVLAIYPFCNKKGSTVSFTNPQGQKVTGTYKGMKRMGGRSYAHVEHEKGATMAPPHHIHQVQEAVIDEAKGKIIHQHQNDDCWHHHIFDGRVARSIRQSVIDGIRRIHRRGIRIVFFQRPKINTIKITNPNE